MKDLTAYQLACGNVQKIILEQDDLFLTDMELYKEHNAFHIRCFKKVKNSSSCDHISWEVFDKLTEARYYWNKMIKFYKLLITK